MTDHETEVSRGERFEFGANWAQFLNVLNDERINLAEQSLLNMLGVSNLQGKRFLDIGNGTLYILGVCFIIPVPCGRP